MKTAVRTLGETAAAAIVAGIVAAIGLFAFSLVDWPSFNSSNVTRSLTTVGQVVAFAALGVSVWLVRVEKWPWVAKIVAWCGLSTFVTFTLGMPLAATKLYLFGISVDQEFRTEFFTRLTDSPALHDMTYPDLPSFYPAGWFWIGGRFADALGLAGWEAFKPYAIASIAVAAVVAYVLWSKLIRADYAIVTAATVTAVVLAYGSPEPYGAVIALGIPPVLILAWGGLHRPANGWAAIAGTGVFVGIAGTFYTLYLGFLAFAVTLMAVVAAWVAKSIAPLLRLLVVGAIAAVLTLVVWAPYLLDYVRERPAASGTATHYLPDAGSRISLPMLHFSLLGGLCLIGLVWLAIRSGTSRRAQALGIGVVAVYLWTLASLAITAAGTTMLSFRLEPILLALLAAAGVFGFLEGARAAWLAMSEPERFRWAVAAVGLVGAIAFAQNIPHVLEPEINTAYTDTDGNGERADKRPPSAVSFYREIDAELTKRGPRNTTVVLTADTSFLSYYPYYGFQALTSHYANPLADFAGRAAAIDRWSKLKTPGELVDALNTSTWRAPDAILFRQGTDGYTLRLAEDVYPNDPNVRRYTVTFPEKLFADPRFTVREIGPFVLVTRV